MECPVIDDNSSTSWTEDEDDLNQGRLAMASLRQQQEKVLKSKSASVPYPERGPPNMANPFADLTKKRRAALTKQNLATHTQIETMKHTALKQREQQQQQQAMFAQKPLFNGSPTQFKLSSKPTLNPRSQSFQTLLRPTTNHHANGHHNGNTNALVLGQHNVINQLCQSPAQYIPFNQQQKTPNPLQSGSPLIYTHTPPQNPIGVNGTNGMLWTQWDGTNGLSPRHRPGLTPQLSINSLPPMTTTNHNGTRTLSTQHLHGTNTNKHQAM